MTTALTYEYTSRTEIEHIYGLTGLTLQVADLKQGNIDDWWQELVADATQTVNQFCWLFYSELDLSNSHWVRRRASWIGAYYLSQRRGNPSLFNLRYSEIIEELNAVMQGAMQIPGLATSVDFTPAMSNLRVDDWYYRDKIRVHQEISTGGLSARQSPSYVYPLWDW